MTFHHVGLILRDVEAAARLHARLAESASFFPLPDWERFGYRVPPLRWERVDAFACACAFSDAWPAVEFVVPDPGSRLAHYLGGVTTLHHVAFAVPDVGALPGPWLFDAPQRGARGLTVNFRPPRDGLLVEIVSVPVQETGR